MLNNVKGFTSNNYGLTYFQGPEKIGIFHPMHIVDEETKSQRVLVNYQEFYKG